MLETAANKVGGQGDEDSDGEELEDDPSNHYICSRIGVSISFGGLCGCHSATDGLDNEGDNIACAEYS